MKCLKKKKKKKNYNNNNKNPKTKNPEWGRAPNLPNTKTKVLH
jgi:hypothetical protein